MTIEEFILRLEAGINLPVNHHLVAVFDSNDSNTVIGVMCVENDRAGEYPVLTIPELYEKYGN